MADYKALTMAFFDEKKLKYSELDEVALRVGFDYENVKNLSVFVIFDKDGEGKVQMVTSPLGTFKGEKTVTGLTIVNQLNNTYRWVKFMLNDSQDLIARVDAIIAPETVGPEVFELVLRSANIIDEAYPDIMRALWA